MKRVYKVALTLMIASLFSACGGGSSTTPSQESINSTTDIVTQKSERMVVGKEYQIYKGDEIEKVSSEPQIEIVTDLEKNSTTATLLSGEANIIRKQ